MAKINLGRIKFSYQGDWDKNTQYRIDDVVFHDNCLWICTNPYLSDGDKSCAPGDKATGFFWQQTFSNDPDFREGYHILDRDEAWSGRGSQIDDEGRPVEHTSRYGSDESRQEHTFRPNQNAYFNNKNGGFFSDYQPHLLHEGDAQFQGDLGNFFGYGELNTEKVNFFQNYVPVRNNFFVEVQTSPSNKFAIDNRVASGDLGKEQDGDRNFTHFREGQKYRFHQRHNSNKTFPLGFSTTEDGIHNSTPGTSLAQDPDGPYYVMGETSTGERGAFWPLYKSAAGANAEDTRRNGGGTSTSYTFTRITRGPNNEEVLDDNTTFYMPDTSDATAVDERIFEVTVKASTSDHPYHGTGSSNKYAIDGKLTKAMVNLNLLEGKTYRFDQSDPSNEGHPLRFSTTEDGTHGSGTAYTTGVTTVGTPGKKGAYTEITVRKSTGKLYYYCTQHANMGYHAETPAQTQRAKSFIPSNIPMWRGANKNGLVRYYLNGRQVTETQYIETFDDTIPYNSAEYKGDVPAYTAEDGTTRGGHYYAWENVQDRTVEIYIPIGYKSTYGTIYPYCIKNDSTKENMYANHGFHLEETWRGYKHWDRLQTGIKFCGEYDPAHLYGYNDVVIYTPKKKRLSDGELVPTGPTGLYRALKNSKGRPPLYDPDLTGFTRGRSPLLAKSITTSGRLTKEIYQDYPAHIQSYMNEWEPFGNQVNQQLAAAHHFGHATGPVHWPYKHGNSDCTGVDNFSQYITQSGKVMAQGYPRAGHQNGGSYYHSYFAELNVQHSDWWGGSDQNEGGYKDNRRSRLAKNWRKPQHTPRCVQLISHSNASGFMLDETGTVYKTGEGSNGEMGTGNTQGDVQTWFWVQGFEDKRIIKISVWPWDQNNHHCMALDEEGNVWTWGYNDQGQIGDGRTQNKTAPYRIPQKYFDNEKVIDIVTSQRSSYARTASDNLYAWGNNDNGQLGDNTTTDKYRPVKMAGWDPAANNGIAVWQACGQSSESWFMILDGNGYLWSTGQNNYGQFCNATTTNLSQLTKSETAPNGDIVDFWSIYWNGYKTTYMRHKDGRTFACGHSGGYYIRGDGATGSISTPAEVDKVKNLRDVQISGNYSDQASVHFLQEDGRMFSYGYDSRNRQLNPHAGSNWTGEDGTNKPFNNVRWAGSRPVQQAIRTNDQGSAEYAGHYHIIDNHGCVGYWGRSYWCANSHNWWSHGWNSPNGQLNSPGIGR